MRGPARQSDAEPAGRAPAPAAPILTCGSGSACGCGGPDWRTIQRFAGNRAVAEALPPSVPEALRQPGEALEPRTRGAMEAAFGRDLGGVRIHTGPGAARAADDLDALAFTSGRHIVFGAGEYRPGSLEGRRLLSHELAHVGQQADGRASGLSGVGGDAGARAALEREASRAPVPSPGAPAAVAEGATGAVAETAPAPGAPSSGAIQLVARPNTCLSLMSMLPRSNLATGYLVERAIRNNFRRRVGKPLNIGKIPGATSAPYRTEGRRRREKPLVIGGLRVGDGKPDIAWRRRGSSVMLIAEIKPASAAGIALGTEQLSNYLDKANSEDNRAWRQRLGVKVFSPLSPLTYTLPRFVRVGPRRFLLAWCGPGLIVYAEDKRRRRKKKSRKDRKRAERRKDKRTTKKATKAAKRKAAKKTPKAPKKAPKGATKAGAKVGAFNFGIGISILSSGAGAANVGVGVSIMSSGVSAGTVSAGIVYDSQGAAVAAVGAGVSVSSSSAAAAAVGAGTMIESEAAGAAVVGTGEMKGSTAAAAGAIGRGKATGVTGAVAGQRASGDVEGEAGAAGAAGGGAGTRQGAGREPPGGVGEAAGAGEGGTREAAAGTRAEAGGARKGEEGEGAGGAGAEGEGGAREGEEGAGGAGGTREGAGGAGGTREGAGGAAAGAVAGRAGQGEGAPTVTVSDAKLAEIVARLGLPRQGPDARAAERAVVDAIRLDQLVSRATPAQKLLMRILAADSDKGVYVLPEPAWVEMMLLATKGLTEEELEYLATLEWHPERITLEELRKSIQRALAARREERRQDEERRRKKSGGGKRKGTRGDKPGKDELRAAAEGKGGGRAKGARRSRLAATPPKDVVAALSAQNWSAVGPGQWLYRGDVTPGLVFGMTRAGTRWGALTSFKVESVGGTKYLVISDSSTLVLLDDAKPGEAFEFKSFVSREQAFFFIEGTRKGEAVGLGLVGIAVDVR